MRVVKKIFDQISNFNKLPGNIDVKDEWLFQTHVHTFIHEVKIYSGKNILFLPEHIIVDGFKMWKGELTNHYLESKSYVFKRIVKSILRPTTKLSGKYLLITDDWSGSYFHWTCDVLQRLYLIKEELKDHIVLIPEHFKKFSYIIESLAIFNARTYFFSPGKNLRIEELMVPSPVGGSGLFRYEVIRGLADFLGKHEKVRNTVRIHPGKIYISRGKAKYRKILNEEEVIAVLEPLGFMVLYTENLSFLEQVQFMSDCKWLVSLHGAGLTNELYLPEGSNVLEIRHPKDHLNNCYYTLATALNLNYFYYLGDSNDNDPHYANISIEIPAFRESITKFLSNG